MTFHWRWPCKNKKQQFDDVSPIKKGEPCGPFTFLSTKNTCILSSRHNGRIVVPLLDKPHDDSRRLGMSTAPFFTQFLWFVTDLEGGRDQYRKKGWWVVIHPRCFLGFLNHQQLLGDGFKDFFCSPLLMEIIQFDENIFQMGCNHLGCPCRKLCWRTGIWWICHFNIARREDCSVREGEQKDGGKTRGNPKIYGKIMWKTIDSSEAVSVYIDYMFWSDILAKPQCNLSLKGAVNVLLWQAKLWGSWQVGSWLHDKLTSNRYTYSIVFWKSQCMWKRIREACQTLYCVYFFAICSAAESNW